MGEECMSRSMEHHIQAQVMKPHCADGGYKKIQYPIATIRHTVLGPW